MHTYTVFGVAVECPFELSELEELDRPAIESVIRWRVEVCASAPPPLALTPTGTESVYGPVSVRAAVSPGVARLAFDDTGTFDVLASHRVIRWHRGPASTPAAVRADLLGRVLALATHVDGALVLHASAVSVDGGAIAFLGPKRAGKSTLATALVRRGARLVTDDMLVVHFHGDAPCASPGVQRVRLWPDSARAVGATIRSDEGCKPSIDDLGTGSREYVEKPLVACYVLQPVANTAAFVKRKLSDVHAALAGVSFSKLGGLAGGKLGADVLERSTRLARAVPMYAVDVPRESNLGITMSPRAPSSFACAA